MPRLTLTLLGGFRAQLGSGASLALTSKKAQALLAYVGVRQGQQISRDTVAALLWGDTGEFQARQNLRQALVSLRQVLPRTGPAVLLTDNETLALNESGIDVDVRAFERLASKTRSDELREALTLFNGDLLEGFRVREAAFEDWLRGERGRLRGRVVDVLERLSAHEVKGEALEAAVQAGLKLLVLDPLQESVHRSLMCLYLQSGRRAAALKQYQVCVDVFQRELGVQPDPATKTLYQQALSRTTQTVTVVARATPDVRSTTHLLSGAGLLIGRQREFGQLHLALDEAWMGHGQLVTILGEAGIGKSRLIQELAGRVAHRGGQIIVGRCFESEQILPFAPWVDVLRSEAMRPALNETIEADARYRAQLARLLPELGRGGTEPPAPAEDYRRIFEAITRVVKALATRQPSVIILEDLHWADDISVRLLVFLARRLGASPLLLVASAREEELLDSSLKRRLLTGDDRDGVVKPVRLAPLSEAETLTLVKHLASAHARRDVVDRLGKRVWRLSEGHPFMVVETMRAVQEGTSAESGDRLPLAERIQRLIVRRLERLGRRSQTLVAVAAVIGREFDYALLQRAAAVSERSAAEGVEELVRHRVLHSVGERIAFTHDCIREVAYGRLLPPRLRLLHGAVARGLEEMYAEDLESQAAALGLHYREAGLFDKAVVHLRRAAAVAVAQGAHHAAVAQLDQARAALAHLPERRDTLEQDIDLLFDLGTSLQALAQFERSAACLGDAERLAAALGDQARLGWASVHLSFQLWMTGNPRRACELATRARNIGELLGDGPLTMQSSLSLGAAQVLIGEYRRADEHLERVITLLQGGTGGHHRGPVLFPAVVVRGWLTLLCADRGEFERGIGHGQEGLRIAEALDEPYSLSFACWSLGNIYATMGRRDDAIRFLERSLALAEDRRIDIFPPLLKPRLGALYAVSGRVAEGLALAQGGLSMRGAGRGIHGLATLQLGMAYLAARRWEDARSAAQQAVTLAWTWGARGAEASALRLLGEISSRSEPCDAEAAEAHYRQSLAIAAELGMRPLLAHCHAGLGRLLLRGADHAQAKVHLDAAATMFREMGMPLWLEQAEAELRECTGTAPRRAAD